MIILCAAIWCPEARAQWTSETSNRHQVSIHSHQDSFYLHYKSIIPESVAVTADGSESIPPYLIKDHYFHWLLPRTDLTDTVHFSVSFRVLPYDLDRWHSRFDSVLYRDGMMEVLEPLRYVAPAGASVFQQEGLKYDGNFSRGLSVGNRQDLVLNSNFDLRMAGPLGDDIEILAALSDNSIPLQPDGNTQQLQEFDRIFIQLSKGRNTLIGGDYELKRPQGHFMNYFKRTQGARFLTEVDLGEEKKLSTSISIAGSKGKFARLIIPGVEGNQGPYRLRGTDGERFIIVLAGSEKIYIDGILLERGLEKDYTIDYNAGEIFFTPHQIITKDKRIIAEYEYSVQSYNRSIYTAELDYSAKGHGLYFNAYSEQDGTLSSGLLDLSIEDKRFLSELGDSIGSSTVSSVRRRAEGFDPNIIMYKLVDSMGFSQVLVRSQNPEEALYTARFTFVGQNQGHYRQTASESNGEVYAWVAPDANGVLQGTHEPLQQLVAPRQQQMFSFGGHIDLGHGGKFRSEMSAAKNDLNRFSDRDENNDVGIAWNNQIEKQFVLKSPDEKPPLLLSTKAMHEFVQRDFQRLNPYRNAEFSRDWNLGQLKKTDEHLTDVEIELSQGTDRSLGYRYGGLYRGSQYQGHRHMIKALYQTPGFRIRGQYNVLGTKSQDNNTTFVRPIIDVSKSLDKDQRWTIGAYFEQEKNSIRQALPSDTLSAPSFYYDVGKLYLRKQQSPKLNFGVSYQKRWDYRPVGLDFRSQTLADDYSISGRWAEGQKSILEGTVTIRELEILDGSLDPNDAGINYLGRITHTLNLSNGFIRTNSAYQVSSGQEPKRTFQYLKVDPGLGVYTFIDVNEDGLQQVNEFEIAAFQEQAEYVRVTVLTNEFIPTNNITFNQSYSIDPQRLSSDKKGLWSKFSNQGSIRIDRKNLQNAEISLWNPFALNVADSSLITVGSQIRNVFYFNRTNPKYNVLWEWQDSRNRLVLTTGFESRSITKHTLRSRINFARTWSTNLAISKEANIQDSENFDLKDFHLDGWSLNPEVTFQPSSTFRITSKYRYFVRENTLPEGGQRATANDLQLESVFNQAKTATLRANLALVLIDFEGKNNPSLEFTMLEGLKDGTNWIWGVAYDRRLANNIRINVSYDGRKSNAARVVHTARAQVSAFF
ncbi:MAG: hypothetical protein KTR24_12270 [Saprospiraceae bacterium]|nr:hypothetical protein [Saprospiraceae bacterium]